MPPRIEGVLFACKLTLFKAAHRKPHLRGPADAERVGWIDRTRSEGGLPRGGATLTQEEEPDARLRHRHRHRPSVRAGDSRMVRWSLALRLRPPRLRLAARDAARPEEALAPPRFGPRLGRAHGLRRSRSGMAGTQPAVEVRRPLLGMHGSWR